MMQMMMAMGMGGPKKETVPQRKIEKELKTKVVNGLFISIILFTSPYLAPHVSPYISPIFERIGRALNFSEV